MPDLRAERRVPVQQLTARLDPSTLPFACTDDLAPLDAVFGQERAVRAIEFSLGMGAVGYNLYAAGPDGLGKASIVESFLRRRAAQLDPPQEWVYVHNFQDADRPIAISLPPGEAREFEEVVRNAVRLAADELQQTFESDSYLRQRQELARMQEERRSQLLATLQHQALGMGFAVQIGPQGITSAPLIDGQPLDAEKFEALTDEQRQEIAAGSQRLDQVVQESLLQVRGIERETNAAVQKLDEQVAAFAVEHHFQPVLDRWGDDTEISEFIDGVRADLVRERDRMRAPQQPANPMLPGASPQQAQQQLFRKYEVNVLVSRGTQSGAPVVVETNPSYVNVIGRIEFASQFGSATTDHTMIKPGSLLLANGGFLVLQMRDLLANTVTYQALKRALCASALRIENAELTGLIPTAGLRPEAIPLDVKVALVGDGSLYAALWRLDPDFRELFRVKADFETDFVRNAENVAGLASMVRIQADMAGLRCFTAGAIARLVEQSSRMVEDQRRLSANMGVFTDLVRQSDYWAAQDGAKEVDTQHVQRALEELVYRSALVRDRMQMLIDDGTIFIETSGAEVGQINALSVYDLGDISFGRPSRITCITAAGTGTITNVERETDMAGAIHNKGFMILRGFMADRFGQRRAMAMHASMTFEQLYGQIDGDSASSTEIYALLSALSGVPLTQSVAVTGSVNQLGEVQPIGGATAKIEGFYDVCRVRGLDGTQGVMIPASNVPNVVLRPDVAAAIEAGQFSVYSAETIEQGIEVLTGVPAGERDAEGKYPEGTVFRRVEDRLDAFALALEKRGGGSTTEITRVPAQGPTDQPPGMPPQPPPPPPISVNEE